MTLKQTYKRHKIKQKQKQKRERERAIMKTMFLCAGDIELIENTQPIGIGLMNASINLTKKLCECNVKGRDGGANGEKGGDYVAQKDAIERIIFIGSAGSYDYEIPLLSTFYATCATQIEQSYAFNKSYCPLDPIWWSDVTKSSKDLAQKEQVLSGAKEAIVNSSNFISMDVGFANFMKERKIILENMEFYAIWRVGLAFNIPVLGIFCISNYCNEFAHSDFVKNHKKTLEILRQIRSGHK